jgi:hypothetical protein
VPSGAYMLEPSSPRANFSTPAPPPPLPPPAAVTATLTVQAPATTALPAATAAAVAATLGICKSPTSRRSMYSVRIGPRAPRAATTAAQQRAESRHTQTHRLYTDPCTITCALAKF